MAEPRIIRLMDTGDDDSVRLQRAARGDETSLRALMARYDRLVRFAIVKLSPQEARIDPQWLDDLAVQTWSAALRAGRKGLVINVGLGPYLVSIARNRTRTALQARARERMVLQLDSEEPRPTQDESHESLVARLDDLSKLRDIIWRLDASERHLFAALPQILDRQWERAADILQLPESTIRSQWKALITKIAQQFNSDERSGKPAI